MPPRSGNPSVAVPAAGTRSPQKRGFAGWARAERTGGLGDWGGAGRSWLTGAAGRQFCCCWDCVGKRGSVPCSVKVVSFPGRRQPRREAVGARARVVPGYADVLGVSLGLRAAEFLAGKNQKNSRVGESSSDGDVLVFRRWELGCPRRSQLSLTGCVPGARSALCRWAPQPGEPVSTPAPKTEERPCRAMVCRTVFFHAL